MTYAFPESLNMLRKYLKSHGFEGSSIKTSRQAAFVAQQLLGTRVKFPPQGQDMTAVLMQIQQAVPGKGIAIMATPQRYSRDTNTSKTKKRDTRQTASFAAKRKREAQQKTFATETFAAGVHIFCDGASVPNPGVGGWGVDVYRDGVEVASQHGGNPETTNNQMEMTGLLVAIEKAGQFSRRNEILPTSASSDSELVANRPQVIIWCDSQYCVEGANVWLQSWKARGWNRKKPNSPNRAAGEIKNLGLWQAIDEALGDSLITGSLAIKWVKGHAGVAGNERADELAEMGRQEANDKVGKLFPLDDLDERYRQIMGAA